MTKLVTKLLLVILTFAPLSLIAETIAVDSVSPGISITESSDLSNARGSVDRPRWSLGSLEGIRSHHDGANCLNGVVTSLGYGDHLTYTDGIELRYFLEHFCRRNHGSPRVGDVLTVLREGTLEHGAIFLGNGRIFEKNSIAGFLGHLDNRADSFYQTKPITKSEYFNECRAPRCFVEPYTCPNYSSVRPLMRRCVEASDRFGVTALREIFQEITLTSNQKFSLGPNAYSSMNKVIRSIESLNGDEECALYLLASSSSIVGQLFNLNEESNLGPSWIEAVESLRTVLKNAKGRILQFDKSDRTVRILRESSWIPK